jgi:hypothetical protein
MPEDVLSQPLPAERRPGIGRTIWAVGLASFLLGAVLVGLLIWSAGPAISHWLGR